MIEFNLDYAFWFKMLELLGSSAGLRYDCNQPADWEYLLAKTWMTEAAAAAILDKLAELDAIDAELWEKIIWNNHFVDNLAPVFVRRNSSLPRKPEFPGRKPRCGGFPVTETDKEKERRV